MRQKFSKIDYILMLFLMLAGIVVLLFSKFRNKEAGATAEVTVNGEYYGSYDLLEQQEIDVEVADQVTNHISISNGEVYMSEANCPDKLCMKQGHKSHQGETIVCLPNRVVVTICSDKKSEFDEVVN